MRKLSKLLALVIFASFSPKAYSQTTMFGGKGLLRVLSAETVGAADLYVNSYVLTFLEKTSSGGLAKDHTWNMGITLGLLHDVELTAKLVPYQDEQRHIWGPPGDTELGLKVHYPFPISVVHVGFKCFFSFPTAQNHNVPYEPFSSGEIGWGAKGLLTFDFTDVLPVLPLKFHTNLGYRDQDMSDRYFEDKKDHLLAGVGFKFPIRSMMVYTEYTAEIFINNPDVVEFRENSMRFSQGFKFLGPWNIILDVAYDYGLAKSNPQKVSQFHKKYADWKIIFGATYHFSFQHYFDKRAKMAQKRREQELKKLEKIREKREKADKDLEEMRKILEKEEKKKKPQGYEAK